MDMDRNINTETSSESYDCTYVFSADEQSEVRKILEKYLPQDEDKLKQLRKLDRSVSRHAGSAALALGIVGGLMHGISLQYVMHETGAVFLIGVVGYLTGIALILSAYPVYRMITAKLRAKLGPQIISLCRELLK